jgi:hypothetical protein
MVTSVKKLVMILGLATVLATPAFAQQDPNDPNDPSAHLRVRAFEQRQSEMTPPYARDIYYERGNKLDPDFPSSDLRWKTLHHRARPPSRTASRK